MKDFLFIYSILITVQLGFKYFQYYDLREKLEKKNKKIYYLESLLEKNKIKYYDLIL